MQEHLLHRLDSVFQVPPLSARPPAGLRRRLLREAQLGRDVTRFQDVGTKMIEIFRMFRWDFGVLTLAYRDAREREFGDHGG